MVERQCSFSLTCSGSFSFSLYLPRTQREVGTVVSAVLNTGLYHDQMHFGPGDPPIWKRVGDTGNSRLNHQLRPIVELHPHLSAGQLWTQEHICFYHHKNKSFAIVRLATHLRSPPDIGHKYRFNNFPCALYQVLSHWRALLIQAGCGEIRAIVGDHLEGCFVFN